MKPLVRIFAAIALLGLFLVVGYSAGRNTAPDAPVCMAPGNNIVHLRPGLVCWAETHDGAYELMAQPTDPRTCTTVVTPGVDHKYGPGGMGPSAVTTCR